MEKQAYFFLIAIFSLITIGIETAQVSHHSTHTHGSLKLFAFGDSYADTGNWDKNSGSWLEPYGFTFPGKPSGRFSDGRVLTDYIASFLGNQTPLPYMWLKHSNKRQAESGMNFAHGGTGVFDTWVKGPNMTTQIDQLKQLLQQNVYTKLDLQSSVALVSASGNDYGFYLQYKNGTLKDMPAFTKEVIKQLAKNLKRIRDLGVGKIVVLSIGPLGCLPEYTVKLSYQDCDKIFNSGSKFHNHLLRLAVDNLNKKSMKSDFIILDAYSTFMWAMDRLRHKAGNSSEYKNPLMPCLTKKDSYGVEEEERKGYVICKHPEMTFFWDLVHPSQNGWHSVYLALKPTLYRLYD
ncbi:hypothetical protein K2173_025153 [Erythroxylum novogranatense]|uniref:GDSL esterase/lipase n=1 Tax=Erythroxylum novogranatense TaxID=1862640 RepID=A0AAV8SVL8_9ROSI|nr:hypothetical protein K2173_025153 [Erythroxylum novogranatense]